MFDDDVIRQEFDERICPPNLPWVDDEDDETCPIEDMIPDMNLDTYEKEINRELDEALIAIKALENKLISSTDTTIDDISNIYTIRLAVLNAAALHGHYESIRRMDTGGNEK